jgi:hypothetical protein
MKAEITEMGTQMTQSAKDRAWTNAGVAFDPSAIHARGVCDRVCGQSTAIMPDMFAVDPAQPASFCVRV